MSVSSDNFILPSVETLAASRTELVRTLPKAGIGLLKTTEHLQKDIVPGLNQASRAPTYYGFVTGGATPAASFADNLVTEYDQNVAVHLPNDTIATDVEDAALRMICDLVDLPQKEWSHRTFTTGATASNVLGLACGREYILSEAGRRKGMMIHAGEDGIPEAMRTAGIDKLQILSTVPHSSLRKAASLVGIGRSNVREVGAVDARHRFDFDLLRTILSEPKTASIVCISCAEINTGFFATDENDVRVLRELCDEFGAWLHVDAAFGLQARCLPRDAAHFQAIVSGVSCLELADSITGDAHKLLNVPYDCGIFLSRHLAIGNAVCLNSGAAYLSTRSNDIPSPLNIGIENSRRFRALPVYATLTCYGKEGSREILGRQILLARRIAHFISEHSQFELLPEHALSSGKDGFNHIYVIVLFRAVDQALSEALVQKINGTRKIYVSGTQWDGRPAARFAVSNWQVDVERDLTVIKEVLENILH